MITVREPLRRIARTTVRALTSRRLLPGLALLAGMLGANPVGGRMTAAPVSFRESLTPLSEIARLELRPVNVQSLRAEDRAAEGGLRPRPVRFAAPIPVTVDPASAGSWEDLQDGARLWRLRVTSPGALSLNLFFRRFDLPEGARMWIYDRSGSRVEGPFSRSDQTPEGQLWTPVLLGDEVVLELHLPAGAGSPGVELGAVNYGYRFFGELPTKQGACNIDVACPEADSYRDQVRSVARYTHSGAFLCTGQLLHNTALDFTPLLLTANHCGVNTANASSVVVYWNFESPSCGQLGGGSLADNQLGATHIASHQPSDFALLELDEVPSPESNVYYAGWDVRGLTPQSVVAIHHPTGDEKAIAIENDPLDSVHIPDYGNPGEENHWMVNAWDLGTTEPGSSGACIFDQETRRCLGVLTGGIASCSTPEGFDVFAKLSSAWLGGGTPETRLADWLDPQGNGSNQELDGGDPAGDDRCRSDAHTACLGNRRFAVRAIWKVPGVASGWARVVPGSSDISTNLYFFSEDNWEMLVKVLDGCTINGHFWALVAGTTDVGWKLFIEDTETGEIWYASNSPGLLSPATADIEAFATCP